LWPEAIFFKIDFSAAKGHGRAFPSCFFWAEGPTIKRPPKPAEPKLTKSPWAGYTSHEHKRPVALATCPNLRCKRLRNCVAAHENLYCQRTHVSHAAYLARQPKRNIIDDLELRREHILARIEQKLYDQKEMKQRWQAGQLDQLYGKYRASGILLQPPPKHYAKDK
jgi:hypothetical protein